MDDSGQNAAPEPEPSRGILARRPLLALGAAAAALLLLGVFLFRPAPATGAENGAFAADCCGTLRLEDGRMLLNGRQSVRYAVGRDSAGPYILPATYVGAFEDEGFEVDGTRPTVKLRLDRLPGPTAIILYRGSKKLRFEREPEPKPRSQRVPRLAKQP
jgi:hypothetical protein